MSAATEVLFGARITYSKREQETQTEGNPFLARVKRN